MARKRPNSREQTEVGTKVPRLAGLGDGHGKFQNVDWGEADTVLIAGVVVSVTRLGGLASFGYTRDGGAATLTLFLDGDRTTVYIKPSEDLDARLAQVVDYFNNLT